MTTRDPLIRARWISLDSLTGTLYMHTIRRDPLGGPDVHAKTAVPTNDTKAPRGTTRGDYQND